MDIKKELRMLQEKLEIMEKVECSASETEDYRKRVSQGEPLPEGVCCANPGVFTEYLEFYRLVEPDVSSETILEYVQCKQLSTLITIKKCVVFFTVLTVISLIGGAISAILLLLA